MRDGILNYSAYCNKCPLADAASWKTPLRGSNDPVIFRSAAQETLEVLRPHNGAGISWPYHLHSEHEPTIVPPALRHVSRSVIFALAQKPLMQQYCFSEAPPRKEGFFSDAFFSMVSLLRNAMVVRNIITWLS